MGLLGESNLEPLANSNSLSWETKFEQLLTSFQLGLNIKDDSFHDRFFTNFCQYAQNDPWKTKKLLYKTFSSWHFCCQSKEPRISLFGMRLSRLYLELWKKKMTLMGSKKDSSGNEHTTESNKKNLKEEIVEEEEEETRNESLIEFETLSLVISQVQRTVQVIISKEDTSIETAILLSTLEVLQSLPEAWDSLNTNQGDRQSFFLLCLKHPSIQIVRAAWKALCKLPSLHLEISDYLTPLFNSVNLLHQLSAAEFFCLKLELNLPILEEELTFLHPYFTSSNRLVRRKLLSLYQLDPLFYKEDLFCVPHTLLLKLLNMGYFEDSLLLLPYLTPSECTEILKKLTNLSVPHSSILLSISHFQGQPLPSSFVDYILDIGSTLSTAVYWPIHAFFTHYQVYTKQQQHSMLTLLHRSFTSTTSTLVYTSLRALEVANLATKFHATLLELKHHEDEGISEFATQLLENSHVVPLSSNFLESQDPIPIQLHASSDFESTPLSSSDKLECELELEDLLLKFQYILDRIKNGYVDSSDEEEEEEEANEVRFCSENNLDCYV